MKDMKTQYQNFKLILPVLFGFVLACLTAQTSFAGLLYQYSELSLKDLDQMSKIVQNKINESRAASGDQVIPLKEALQAVYSRSNEDFMIEKIISPLKNELDEQEAWESSLQELTKEAIGALKNPKAFKPITQVTYIVFLENVLSELKPKVNEKFENSIIDTIAKAKISVTKAAADERQLRVMKATTSPSEIAQDILKQAKEATEKNKK